MLNTIPIPITDRQHFKQMFGHKSCDKFSRVICILLPNELIRKMVKAISVSLLIISVMILFLPITVNAATHHQPQQQQSTTQKEVNPGPHLSDAKSAASEHQPKIGGPTPISSVVVPDNNNKQAT